MRSLPIKAGLMALTMLVTGTACSGRDREPAFERVAAGTAPESAPPVQNGPASTAPVMPPAADNVTDDPLGRGRPATPDSANLGGDEHPIVPQPPLGTIEIPKIALDDAFYEGVELPNLHWGPGHWPGTALPGQFGNTVIAGHRVTHTRPFLDIDQLVTGDRIILTTRAGRFVYEVIGHEIVGADDVRIADPTLTPTVTLMACHPKGSLQQRYVVRGRLIG